MKPLNTTLKAKKLAIKKETLRTLTESDLRRVDGAVMTTSWCSTISGMSKCQIFSSVC